MTPRQSNPDRATINATVPAWLKGVLASAAEDEDRDIGRVVQRAVLVYVNMPRDEREAAVRAARDTSKDLPE